MDKEQLKLLELYASIVNSTDDAILSKNLDGIINTWNKGAEMVFGYSADEIIGKPFSILVPPSLFEEEKGIMDKIRAGEYVNHYETERIRKDGKIIPVSLTISPLKDASGNIIGAAKISRDISARIYAEQKILKSKQHYAFISAINQSIVHIGNEQELIDNACKIAIKIGGFKASWIALLDEEERLIIRGIGGDEPLVEELKKFSGHKFNTPELRDTTTGKVLYTGKYVVRNRLQTDPDMVGYRDVFVRHGIKSTISFPIKRFGKVIGSIGFHSHTEDYFNEGEVLLLIEAADDISFAMENFAKDEERKKSREFLELSEMRLKEAQVIAKMGNWEIDLNSNKHTWSEEFYKIFGLRKNELEPSIEAFVSFIHNDYRAFAMKKMEDAFKSLTPSSFNFRFRQKNGSDRFGYTEWRFEFDTDNNPLRIYGILQDITERKKAEQLIFESAARLAEAQEIARIGNWETDLLTFNLIWSAQMFRIFEGKPESQMLSHHVFLEFVHPEDREKVDSAFKASFSNEDIHTHIHRILMPNGLLKFVEEKWQIQHNELGIATRAVGTTQDITERVLAEQKLEEQNRELLKINSELDRFVYSASHDLRAPLLSLLGIIELMREELLPGDNIQAERIAMMKKSILKLDNFIEEILDYSRNTRSEIAHDEIDLERDIQNVRENLLYMEGSQGMRLEVKIEKDEKFISDARRMNVILSNLISNAIKYQDPSKKEHFIHIHANINSQETTIIVEDNGEGIDSKHREKIFEMFYRGSKQSSGAGLGLYILKETLEKLNGSIAVESEKGIGSKFIVTIPNLLHDESK